MMRKFCEGMAKAADERKTTINENNFEVIKTLYNETEDNKLSYLIDIILKRYVCPLFLAIGVFMINLIANDDAKTFLELLQKINPWILEVFIFAIAFIKMMNDRDSVLERDIYRKKVTYVMWKVYTDIHNIDVYQSNNEKKKSGKIRRFLYLEKWTLLKWLYVFWAIIILTMTYIPRTNNIIF